MKKLSVVLILGLIVSVAGVTAQARSQRKPLLLTLKDAIVLALRDNPGLQSAELGRITQKYSLMVAKNEFEPKYSLGASWNHTESRVDDEDSRSTSNNLQASVGLKTAYGTEFKLSSDNPMPEPPGYWNPALSLSITQPLLKGFGRAVVEAALNDALDSEVVNKLNFKSTVISTVDAVINNYVSLFQAKERIAIDRASLKQYARTLAQTKAFIKAGRRAKIDLLETQSQSEQLMVQLQNDKNTYQQKFATFLDSLGLQPDVNVKIPDNIDFDKLANSLVNGKNLLSLKQSKQIALQNNIGYQVEGFTLKSLKRALVTANDGTHWKLDLTVNGSVGNGAGGGSNSSINSLMNGRNESAGVGLILAIPIDDMSAKQTLLSAKVGLEQGEINYKEKKRDLELQVESVRNTVISSEKQLMLAKQALKTRQKTLKMMEIKQKAGLIPMSQLLDQQEDLIQSEQSVLSAKIGYVNSLVAFNTLLSVTLYHWGIKIRY